jgi:hypothetical protein
VGKGFRLDAFRKPLKAMDGFQERQDGSMRVCERHQDETPCWHSVFSPGIAAVALGFIRYSEQKRST